MALKLNISDETSTLDAVILGIAEDLSGPGSFNPGEHFHHAVDSYPTQASIATEINSLEKALIENGVKVFRPLNIKNKIQLFTRDIGFVIDDLFFVSNMISPRQIELRGIEYILELLDPKKIIYTSRYKDLEIEGGDIVIKNDIVFVGLSGRTNDEGFEFLRKFFAGKKKVVQIKLTENKKDDRLHPLHLDCVFQPIGDNYAIVYEDGIKNLDEFYENINIPEQNIFQANTWQFFKMYPNVLSLAKDTVIIEREFIELKYWLEDRNFKVVEVNFNQISKLSGLLRCCTLPLVRK
jgi:N-dimethylarginine dimethylaminohydrolase